MIWVKPVRDMGEPKILVSRLGAPGLRYYAAQDGAGRVKMVGSEFNRKDIGFLFRLASPLRRQVSRVLVALREDGTYDKYYDKWFGSE